MNRSLLILCSAAVMMTAAATKAKAICSVSSGVYDYSVTQTAPSTWNYDYLVENGCAPNHQPLLTDFYVPYFADAGIANITVPDATLWSYAIQPNNNLFNLAGAGVIDFHVTWQTQVFDSQGNLVMQNGLGYYGANGFTFTSGFAPVKGPFAIQQTAWNGGLYNQSSVTFGDPSIPGSPDTISALNAVAAPEPAFAWLLAAGVLGMAAFKLSRRNFSRAA